MKSTSTQRRNLPAELTGMVLTLALAWSAACCPPAAAPKPGARATLAAYAEHLRRGENEAALKLVSSAAAAHLSADKLASFVAAGGDSLGRLLAEAGPSSERPGRFLLHVGKGDVVLVEERGQWRIASGPLLPSASESPGATLAAFLRAMEDGDCQSLVDTAPPAVCAEHTRNKLEQACKQNLEYLRQLAADIRRAGAEPVESSDGRAVLNYGHGRRLVLLRVDDRWYIEDL